ncbi:SUF system NifU family Fe-S cluster assembly protein [Ruminococcaceae bacterium OttesenSCG-928-A16]|nr:SUF system NifU family Fe-S cluster assembly protein [Ruminococcaceae bacterium OttesenSCG-928-A16]
MPIDNIYTEIVAEHSRSAHNRRHVENPTTVLRGVNPSCGDDITLELREKNGIIEDAAFTGDGCAISQASTSMMIDLIKGKPVKEAMQMADLFLAMIKGNVTDEAQLEELEDAMALQGISHMPARVKCAVLAWRTLEDACGHTPKE